MKQTKSNQYLMEHLKFIEESIERHAKASYSKRYLILRDGYPFTGTDSMSDVVRIINTGEGLYSYRLNKRL